MHEPFAGLSLLLIIATVPGKHGAGMFEELLLGRVTKHMLSQARCDVLVSCL